MHKYRHKKLPTSFSGIFIDTTTTDSIQSRHNDYNYQNVPAIRKNLLENFPIKQIIFNWNYFRLELKTTADPVEFGNTYILQCHLKTPENPYYENIEVKGGGLFCQEIFLLHRPNSKTVLQVLNQVRVPSLAECGNCFP